MIEDDLLDLVDPVMRGLGSAVQDGEEFRDPPLDVLRYYRRPVRLGPIPWFGRGASVVAIARQPVDVGLAAGGYPTLLNRLARAADGRFRPGSNGPALGLTALILTPEPIGPGDDAALAEALADRKPGRDRMRTRSIPLGLIRANLGQEALAFALAADPDALFPEAAALADALAAHLRRFVPLLEY